MANLTLACLHELKASLLTMFNYDEWKISKFGTSQKGRKVENVVLVDKDIKLAMGFIVQRKRLSAISIILRKGKYFIPFLFQNLIAYLWNYF